VNMIRFVRAVDDHVSTKSNVFKEPPTSQTVDLSPFEGLEEVEFGIKNFEEPDSWVVAVLKTIPPGSPVRKLTFDSETYFTAGAVKRMAGKLSENWSELDRIIQVWTKEQGGQLEIVFYTLCVSKMSDNTLPGLDEFLKHCCADGRVTVKFELRRKIGRPQSESLYV
jgi:hypothetical protein